METCSLWEATLKFSLYCWLNFSWGHSKALSKEEPSWAVCPKMAISKKWILESKRGPTHMVPEPLHMSVSIRFNLQKTKRNPTEIRKWHEKEWTQSLFFFKLSCKTSYLQIFLTIVVVFGHRGWNIEIKIDLGWDNIPYLSLYTYSPKMGYYTFMMSCTMTSSKEASVIVYKIFWIFGDRLAEIYNTLLFCDIRW